MKKEKTTHTFNLCYLTPLREPQIPVETILLFYFMMHFRPLAPASSFQCHKYLKEKVLVTTSYFLSIKISISIVAKPRKDKLVVIQAFVYPASHNSNIRVFMSKSI